MPAAAALVATGERRSGVSGDAGRSCDGGPLMDGVAGILATTQSLQRGTTLNAMTDDVEAKALELWFEISGTTMTDLKQKIDRLQPGDSPVDSMGLDPAIALEVMENKEITNPRFKLQVILAMQTVAMKHVQKLDRRRETPKQLSLF